MSVRSALKITGVLLLVSSLGDVQANDTYRAIRAGRILQTDKTTRGIGGVQYLQDLYGYSSKSSSKAGKGGKSNSKSGKHEAVGGRVDMPYHPPIGSPTLSPAVSVNGPDSRIPVHDERPAQLNVDSTPVPTEHPKKPSFWHPGHYYPETDEESQPQDGSELEGRNDFTNDNDNQESQIEVNVDDVESSVQPGGNLEDQPSAPTGAQDDVIDALSDAFSDLFENIVTSDGGDEDNDPNGESPSIESGGENSENPSTGTEGGDSNAGEGSGGFGGSGVDNGSSAGETDSNGIEGESDSSDGSGQSEIGSTAGDGNAVTEVDSSESGSNTDGFTIPVAGNVDQENGNDESDESGSNSDGFIPIFGNVDQENGNDESDESGSNSDGFIPIFGNVDQENGNDESDESGSNSDGFIPIFGNVDQENGNDESDENGSTTNGETSVDGTINLEDQNDASNESGSTTNGETSVDVSVIQENQDDASNESGSTTNGETSVDVSVIQENQDDASNESGSTTNGETSVDGTIDLEDQNDGSDESESTTDGETSVDGTIDLEDQNDGSDESESTTDGETSVDGTIDLEDQNDANDGNGNNDANENPNNEGTDGWELIEGNLIPVIENIADDNKDNEINENDAGSESTTDGETSVDGTIDQEDQTDANNEGGSNTAGDTSVDENVADENQDNGKSNMNESGSTTTGGTSVDGNVVSDNNDGQEMNDADQSVESGGIENNGGAGNQSDNENADSDLVLDPNAAVFCPNVSPDKEVLINWIYAVEFYPNMTPEQKAESIAIMELELVSEILKCNTPVSVLPGKLRHRNLVENDGIAGLNYMPLDAKNDDVLCFANSTAGGVCETYFGRMEMYLQEDADEKLAIDKMLYAVRETLQRKNDFPSAEGIVQVWYLEPNLDVSNIADVPNPDPKPPIEQSFSTGTMIAFAALGVFVFAAMIMGVFRLRRNYHDGVSTLEPGSSMAGSNMSARNESYEGKLPCSFSAMLPNSYKLDESDAMSAIPEADSDCESKYNDCSVIVSEGGYTSDGSSHAGNALHAHNFVDPVLGDLDEDNLDTDKDLLFENTENYDEIHALGNAMKFESDREFSEHRKKHLVTGEDVSLGVRHSTVDVHQCTSARCKICNYKPNDVEFIHNSPNSPDVSTGKFFAEMDEDNTEKEI